MHNALFLEGEIDKNCLLSLKEMMISVEANSLYKEKNKISSLIAVIEEVEYSFFKVSLVRRTISGLNSTNLLNDPFKEDKKSPPSKINLKTQMSTRITTNSFFRKNEELEMISIGQGGQVGGISTSGLINFYAVFESNDHDFTFIRNDVNKAVSLDEDLDIALTTDIIINRERGVTVMSNKFDRLDNMLREGKNCENLKDYYGSSQWYFDILEWSALDIARQLTIITFEIYNKIKPSELVNCSWTKKNKHITSPNILKLIYRSNTLYLWIIEEILSYDRKVFRYKVIEKLYIL